MDADTKDLLLIHKPRGMSSFGVIRELRKKLKVQKIGHAGTLDPLAEGLLLVGVGQGTKKLSLLIGLDKVYEVEIELGERTTSGDKDGKVIEEKEVREEEIEMGTLLGVLKSLEGEVELPVPLYSAVKREGVPLYMRARAGETFSPPKRVMNIHSLQLQKIRSNPEHTRVFLSLVMHVASGVYVRSVAEEIGARLGLPATVSRLIRTQIGDFLLTDAHSLDEF